MQHAVFNQGLFPVTPIPATFQATVLACLLVPAWPLYAADQSRSANPIAVESLNDEDKPFRAPVIEPEDSGVESVYQRQVLQQEVQELRGRVEELSHEIKLMKSTDADRYLELDRRLEDFRRQIGQSGAIQAEIPVNSPEVNPDAESNGAKEGQAPQADQSAADEKSLYDTALKLIRSRQYDLAIKQLDTVIREYPEGQYTPNAYYWLGEVYAAMPDPDYEMARQSLAQVISFFPDSRKVPDAAFKLGKVYNMMGDCVRARDILTQVIQQHQGTTVAKLAETYLRDKVACDQ